MAVIKLDGVSYELEDGVATAVQSKIDALSKSEQEALAKKELLDEELQKEKDEKNKALEENTKVKAKSDALEEEVKALKAKKDSVDLEALVSERMDTIDKAKKIKADVKLDGLDTVGIMKAVLGEKVDGKDEVYVRAYFDAKLDAMEANANGDLNGGTKNPHADSKDPREALMKKMQER